jgi:protein-disulfide isomerase
MTEEKTSVKSDTITIKKDALWKYSTIVLGVALVLVVLFAILPGKSTTGNVVVDNPGAVAPIPPANAKVNIDDDPVLGDEDAEITIVEFSDYQCPFCRSFYTQTLPQLKREYIDTGKVKFVYRDFPLSFHPGAIPAASGAECARDIYGEDAYWKLHDKIFEEQGKQGQGTVQFTADDVKSWAQEIGYDVVECMNSGKFESEIQKDFADGQAAGVRGTPGFIILKGDSGTGVPISGAQPFAVFQQAIEAIS